MENDYVNLDQMGIGFKVLGRKLSQPGIYYPPVVANPGGLPTPIGELLFAHDAGVAHISKTGREQIQAGGAGTVRSKQYLSHRPGFHILKLPYGNQFFTKDGKLPWELVYALVRYSNEVDYQEQAMRYGFSENGKFRHAYAGLPYIPVNGCYEYRTNPNPDAMHCIIAGAMIVERILPDDEVAKILTKNGIVPPEREVR